MDNQVDYIKSKKADFQIIRCYNDITLKQCSSLKWITKLTTSNPRKQAFRFTDVEISTSTYKAQSQLRIF